MYKLGLSVALASALATPAFACDLCSIYSASLARNEIGGGFFAGASEQFTHFGTVQVEGHPIANPTGQYLNSSISQLFAGYNFNNRLGVQLNLPVIYRSFKRPDGFAIDRGTESGIGDVSLLGHFNAYRWDGLDGTFAWSILGGIKFPTGRTDRLREEFSEMETAGAPASGIHGHDLTLGTGSVDGLVGTGFFARWKRLFLLQNAQYAIRTKGDFDYQFANDLTWSGGPGVYLVLTHYYSLGLQWNLSGEYKGFDTFQGAKAEDTSVTALYMGPQLNMTWGEHFSGEITADLPVSIENSSLQTVPDYRIRAGLNWRF